MQYNGRLENTEIIFNLRRKMDITEDNSGRYATGASSCGTEDWEAWSNRRNSIWHVTEEGKATTSEGQSSTTT